MLPAESTRDLAAAARALLARLRAVEPELLVAAPFALVFAFGLVFGLPLSLPDLDSLGFVERHYFRPLLLAAVLQAVVLGLRGRSGRARLGWRALGLLVLLVAVTIVVHFNFKAWMPLVHRRLFDAELQRTDQWFGGLVPALVGLRSGLEHAAVERLHVSLDPLYHSSFVAMFFVAFSAHALFDTSAGLRKVVLGACLVLLVGGIAYWLMPARGPFMTRAGGSGGAVEAQRAMSRMFDTVRFYGQLPHGYFVAPLAAMPSLHTAHAVLFCIYAQRRVRWLGLVFYPTLAWILFEAVASGWHYVLDLPAGALLAWLCVRVADRLVPETDAALATKPSAA